MLGVEGYGSDNDSDGEFSSATLPATKPTLSSTLPPPSEKSTFSLPPPSNSGPSLPAPKGKRAPKKITIGLPSLDDDGDNGRDVDERPAAKKPRLESGAGVSSLLFMLPAPKQKAPALPPPQRVLGGGSGPGLVFNTRRLPSTSESEKDNDLHENDLHRSTDADTTTDNPIFLPPSLKKGRSNISVEEDARPKPKQSKVVATTAVDFFSLDSSSSSSAPSIKLPPLSSKSASPQPTSLSAPKVDDFVPPEPTPTDPYPGYYLLPNGSWAAHDAAYYKKFYDKWQREYNAHVRALEKGVAKGFEGADGEDTAEVNAMKEMERAKKEIQEREEKKALTQGADGAPAAPRMNIKGAKLGGRARSRHQLSTLLTEAYENREALEERIAEGRRNRKEAGNKYGF